MLDKYGVDRLEDLPIDINAARLLAMEKFTDSVDDRIQSQVVEVYRQQSKFIENIERYSPYLMMRSVSSALAGTNRDHHRAFLDSAEEYRRQMVELMNTSEMKGQRPGSTPESSRSFWAQVPEFQSSFPKLIHITNSLRWPITILIGWCITMIVLALLPRMGTAP